ncbi:DUF2550 family protein [Aquipuribacter nitratireducens]|uniref:DUF2550 family protein n=1 Tax=Aquipuribacter nitratireducens TaxID=650104 RepID=A0ABW0GLJ2_9MICO
MATTWRSSLPPEAFVLVALGVVVALVLALVLRWRHVSRGLGAFRCYVRLPGSAGALGRWRRGAARFDTHELRWFPTWMPFASRGLCMERSALELFGRWTAGEGDVVPDGLTVLRGSLGRRDVELAVPASSAAALVLWVESGPPGRNVNVA